VTVAYGIAETIGFRPHMEDAHAIWDEEQFGFFSAEVYDGHGGSLAAVLAAEVLTPYFLHHRGNGQRGKADEKVLSAEALREAYLDTDRYIIGQRTGSGTAAATLYLHNDRFLAANAGDVRIVVGQGKGALELTKDHKPDLPEEKARIEALGGKVISYDVARVEGTLSMSRALGDAPLKPFVTAEPRIAEGVLGKENDVAVVACDGIWDVMTSEEAVALARSGTGPEDAARLLQTRALERGSMDNITVVVLDLRGYTALCGRSRLSIVRVLDRALVAA